MLRRNNDNYGVMKERSGVIVQSSSSGFSCGCSSTESSRAELATWLANPSLEPRGASDIFCLSRSHNDSLAPLNSSSRALVSTDATVETDGSQWLPLAAAHLLLFSSRAEHLNSNNNNNINYNKRVPLAPCSASQVN